MKKSYAKLLNLGLWSFLSSMHLLAQNTNPLYQTSIFFEELERVEVNCLGDSLLLSLWRENDYSHPPNQESRNDFPGMVWPMGNALYDQLFILNYVDHLPGMGQLEEYMCGNELVYDGHRGTDISTINYRLMDKGMPVVAAAAGRVTNVIYDNFDRNYDPPYIGSPNLVSVLHDDGSRAIYVHLRKNSVPVKIDETVEAGQFLGYIATSGATPIPHLHIEFWEYPNGVSTYRDPWEGACQSQPSLWIEQEAYAVESPGRVFDLGVFTEASIGGDFYNISNRLFKDRIPEPVIFGTDEPNLAVWAELQVIPPMFITFEIYKPDGTLFQSFPKLLSEFKKIVFELGVWNFNSITTQDHGTWTYRFVIGGETAMEKNFEVGNTTVYAPRFYPLNGKSLRLEGHTQYDTLRMAYFSPEVDFHLVDAPDFVELQDSIITIPADATLQYRNDWFQVVATDSEARTDSMWYHLVDENQPVHIITSSEKAEVRLLDYVGLKIFPNPTSTEMQASWQMPEPGEVAFQLLDITGKIVRQQAKKYYGVGAQHVLISLSDLPAGIYQVLLSGENFQVMDKVVKTLP